MSSNDKEYIGTEEEYLKHIRALSDEKLLEVLKGAIKGAQLIAEGKEEVLIRVGRHCVVTVSKLIARELVRRHKTYVIER